MIPQAATIAMLVNPQPQAQTAKQWKRRLPRALFRNKS